MHHYVHKNTTIYSLGYGLGPLVGVEAVRILVHAEFIQGGEGPAAHVTAVLHLVLVALGVLQKSVQLLKRLAAALHDALVHLQPTDSSVQANASFPRGRKRVLSIPQREEEARLK